MLYFFLFVTTNFTSFFELCFLFNLCFFVLFCFVFSVFLFFILFLFLFCLQMCVCVCVCVWCVCVCGVCVCVCVCVCVSKRRLTLWRNSSQNSTVFTQWPEQPFLFFPSWDSSPTPSTFTFKPYQPSLSPLLLLLLASPLFHPAPIAAPGWWRCVGCPPP